MTSDPEVAVLPGKSDVPLPSAPSKTAGTGAKRPHNDSDAQLESVSIPVCEEEESSSSAVEGERKKRRVSVDDKRGARMFGLVMGTLNRFKQSSGTKTEAQIRRESIEKRLSERLAKERSELEDKLKVRTQERLATQRNAEQARLGVRRDFQTAQSTALSSFLSTRSYSRDSSDLTSRSANTLSVKISPVLWLPAKHNDVTLQMLAARKRDAALQSMQRRSLTEEVPSTDASRVQDKRIDSEEDTQMSDHPVIPTADQVTFLREKNFEVATDITVSQSKSSAEIPKKELMGEGTTRRDEPTKEEEPPQAAETPSPTKMDKEELPSISFEIDHSMVRDIHDAVEY